MLAVLLFGLRHLGQNHEFSVASNLARHLHEKLRSQNAIPIGSSRYVGATPDPAQNGFPPAPYPSLQRDGIDYTFDVTVTPQPSRPRLVSVEVRVRWGEGHQVVQEAYYYAP